MLQPPDDGPDHSTAAGAAALCERIAAFWVAHGYAAPALRVEGGQWRTHSMAWLVGVRSDMINAMPRQRVGKAQQ
jgi:hypothetical protein